MAALYSGVFEFGGASCKIRLLILPKLQGLCQNSELKKINHQDTKTRSHELEKTSVCDFVSW